MDGATMKKPPKTAKRVPTPPYYVPTPQAALTTHKPLVDLTPDEAMLYLEQLRARLIQKQQRERAYLDRRAARGIHAPTDEVYEADQVLEGEILALFDDLYQTAKEARGMKP